MKVVNWIAMADFIENASFSKAFSIFFLFILFFSMDNAGSEEMGKPKLSPKGTHAVFSLAPGEVEKDERWEEVFIAAGSAPTLCGNGILFGRSDGVPGMDSPWVAKIEDGGFSLMPYDGKVESWLDPCHSEEKYAVLQKTPPVADDEGNRYGPWEVEIYSPHSKKRLATLSVPDRQPVIPLFSPDWLYLAWFQSGTVSLGDGGTITLVPVFQDIPDKYALPPPAWSADGRKVYQLLLDRGECLLSMYDVVTKTARTIKLGEGRKDFFEGLYADPAGEGLILHGIFQPGEKGGGKGMALYKVDLAAINWDSPSLKPRMLVEHASSVSISGKGDMVFHIARGEAFRHPDGMKLGVFLVEKGEKAVKRLTENSGDHDPFFSKDGKAIFFSRWERGANGKTADNLYLLKRKASVLGK